MSPKRRRRESTLDRFKVTVLFSDGSALVIDVIDWGDQPELERLVRDMVGGLRDRGWTATATTTETVEAPLRDA